MNEMVPVPRWWLEQVRNVLQGELPSGRIGDCVFILREQINDLLTSAQPSTERAGK